MRTELPKKWCFKASNNEEAELLAPYATEMSLNYGFSNWNVNDCLTFYLKIENGKYVGGNYILPHSFELLTFEEFKSLVLGEKQQPTEPQYEIY